MIDPYLLLFLPIFFIGIFLPIFFIGIYLYLIRYKGQLDDREERLEAYARDLENWETTYKVRNVALSNVLRYADRLAEFDPVIREQVDVIRRELFPNV